MLQTTRGDIKTANRSERIVLKKEYPKNTTKATSKQCLIGDVSIGENSRVLFGAIIVAEGGPVEIGANCIIMENAVIRGTPGFPTRLGNAILVGPRAYLTGCIVEESVFLATGATVFNGAHIGTKAEVRIHYVVAGDGPRAIVLLHGFPETCREWRAIILSWYGNTSIGARSTT